MIRPKLKIGNSWLSLDDLMNSQPVHLTDAEKNSLAFCQRWIRGDQQFEFHTSGSTGSPKKIIFQRYQLEASARLTAEALQLNSGFTALVCLDTQFIAGAMMLVRSLVTGMNMIVVPPSSNPFTGITEKIDFVALVPYQLSSVIKQSPDSLQDIKTAIIGGASIGNELIQQLQNFSCDFYSTYGMTETVSHIALQKLNNDGRQDFFVTLPGVTVGKDMRECLIIYASHLSSDPIIANDVVNLIDEKRFQWLGRYDQIINTGGIKVNPEKVEQIVAALFKVMGLDRRFFIIGSPDPNLGQQVTLIIEGAAISSEDVSSLTIDLGKSLAKYEIPRQILYSQKFQETSTQKIDRLKTLQSINQG